MSDTDALLEEINDINSEREELLVALADEKEAHREWRSLAEDLGQSKVLLDLASKEIAGLKRQVHTANVVLESMAITLRGYFQ